MGKDFWLAFVCGVAVSMWIGGMFFQYSHAQCAKEHNVFKCEIKWEPVK